MSLQGLGTDIVEIPKLKEVAVQWKEKFLHRIFTEDEQAYCFKKADPYSSLAARFAVKEAAKKALHALGLSVTPFRDIEIRLDESGAPHLVFEEKLQSKLKNYKSHVSLSHHGAYAIATVVLELSRS